MREEQQKPITNEQVELKEEEEKAREDALVELLGKVNLNDPVIVEDARGKEVAITKQQIIDFYLPEDTNQLEAFHCVQQLRASGLNILIKGQCHFVKFGDGALSLYTGYEVYLARAYNNGMEHMEEPVWEIGEDGLPVSCTLTIHIKDRKPFTRTTRYAEVVAMKNNMPNSRWKRAPFQMTEKCTIVNTLRLSGIAAVESLPHAVEEMGDSVADGYRTLTQEQLDDHDVEQAEAAPGDVTASTHQVDTGKDRKRYFVLIGDMKLFANDDQRKACQVHFTGKESAADFDHDDFSEMFAMIASGKVAQWVQDNPPKPDPPAPGTDEFLENLDDVPEEHQESADENAAESNADDAAQGDTQTEAEKEQEATAGEIVDDDWAGTADKAMDASAEATSEWDVKSSTRKQIGVQLVALNIYDSPRSDKFKDRIEKLIGRRLLKMQAMMEVEGQKIIASLDEEIAMIGTIDDEPVDGNSEEAEEAEAQEQAAEWFESAEFAGQLNSYMLRAAGRFADVTKSTAWHQSIGLNGSARYWSKDEFDQGNSALDELDKADSTKPQEPTEPQGSEDANKVKSTKIEEIKRLFGEWMPDKKSSIGTPTGMGTDTGQAFLRGVVDGYKGLYLLDESQLDDIIHALQDRETDAEKNETKTPNVG